MDYERKTKEVLPVLAICYDFDKTLTPDNMQAQGYIQSVGYDVDRFWEETDNLAHQNGIDSVYHMQLLGNNKQKRVQTSDEYFFI